MSAPVPEIEERAKWGGKAEFVMSCIAMNIGLGNVWRFPFVTYENGGGAFIIPYIIVLITLGRPMYYLEMCLGQFTSQGNVQMFYQLAPVLKGVGMGQVIGTFSVATYYCSVMSITLFYLVQSLDAIGKPLPWAECDPAWNDSVWLENTTCIPSSGALIGNGSINTISSAEAYFRIVCLKESRNVDDGIGYPNLYLVLCLLVAWYAAYSSCKNGVPTIGKSSYFLALFPYVILIGLLVRAVTLEGAFTGIYYFLYPDWTKLYKAQVWYAAVTQCFFSLNIGFGCVTIYASFNDFKHNIWRDALIVAVVDTCTSLLSGLIIFGILGNLSKKLGVDVTDVIKAGGTGLAFISYPEALAHFDAVPWLFAILFFGMLFVLAVGCLVADITVLFNAIKDSYPQIPIWILSGSSCIIGFLLGFSYCTPGGQWVFQMVDFFGGTFIFIVLTIFECTAVSWWYGLENICWDCEYMLDRKTGIYWRLTWGILSPMMLIGVLLYFLATFKPLTYERKEYPTYIIAWGWGLLALGVIQPLVWWIYECSWAVYRGKSLKEAFKDSFKHDDWMPKNAPDVENWRLYKQQKERERDEKNRNWLVHKLCILIGKN